MVKATRSSAGTSTIVTGMPRGCPQMVSGSKSFEIGRIANVNTNEKRILYRKVL